MALAGSSVTCGAFCCTSRAICVILRNEDEVASVPKETAWNESGLLVFKVVRSDRVI